MTRLAVIDVETTGLNPYRHDRVIELAALVMNLDGEVSREFVTLINPERDIGPTTIHGITASDIVAAPQFAEVAGSLIEILNGCVAIAGHNIRFDHSFLSAEFSRLGLTFPLGPTLCTMNLSGGGSLS
ncbi:MAG TPA: exonuclease domain-containing protein, partial [Candidatus Binatus sp.]|nr:exonuclease domain-containing protein [Candidatus Binatus sp.]